MRVRFAVLFVVAFVLPACTNDTSDQPVCEFVDGSCAEGCVPYLSHEIDSDAMCASREKTVVLPGV